MNALTLNLTPAERAEVLKAAAAQLAERLYTENRDDLQIISKTRAAGILDVDVHTLDKIGLPRVVLSIGKLVKYRLSDISAFIDSRREK